MFEPNTGQFEGYKRIIPHLKVFVMTDDDWEINDNTVIYFGSHNCTPSAWGRYEKNETLFQVANTELGVVYPPAEGSATFKKQLVEGLPFKFPPRKFTSDEQPFFTDHMVDENRPVDL